MKEMDGFESQFFEWEGWDIQDTMSYTFYNITLKVDLGEGYEKGSAHECVNLMLDYSLLEIIDGNDVASFKIKATLEKVED